MKEIIITFFTHYGAIYCQKKLQQAGYSCKLGPVPRRLSSSCGTCVHLSAPEPPLELLSQCEPEMVAEKVGEGYEILMDNR